MATPKKLVCDKCGKELTDKDDIEMAIEGALAWHESVRARGGEPRGLFPCENYRNCGGEMTIVKSKGKGLFRLGGNNNK